MAGTLAGVILPSVRSRESHMIKTSFTRYQISGTDLRNVSNYKDPNWNQFSTSGVIHRFIRLQSCFVWPKIDHTHQVTSTNSLMSPDECGQSLTLFPWLFMTCAPTVVYWLSFFLFFFFSFFFVCLFVCFLLI